MAQALRILGPDGKPVRAPSGDVMPRPSRLPPIQVAGRFKVKSDFQGAVELHKLGYFYLSSWLVEQMMSADRVSSGMQTRCDGLVGTPIQFVAGQDNERGRRVARLAEEDFDLIASPTSRAAMHATALMSGVAVAQEHWFVSPSSGRAIPRIEPWSNLWINWDWALYAYRVWTWGGGWQVVPAPALIAPGETWTPQSGVAVQADPRAWVVYEPFGQHSWRSDFAFIHSLWEAYFGYALANNDMNRVCEKQGRGQMKLKFPTTTDKAARDEYIGGLLDVNAEGIFPLEQFGTDVEGKVSGYELGPFSWPATGFDIVNGTKESNAASITIRILGHNTQGETKGSAGAGGGAAAGSLIRGDIRVGDTLKESTYLAKVLGDWAEVNFGDRSLAPRLKYVTEEPMANVQAGQTANFVGTSVDALQRHGVDTPELLRRFQMPLRPEALAPDFKPEPPPAKGEATKPTDPESSVESTATSTPTKAKEPA